MQLRKQFCLHYISSLFRFLKKKSQPQTGKKMNYNIRIYFIIFAILFILLSLFQNLNCQAPKKQSNPNKKYNTKSIDSLNNPIERSTPFYHELPVGIQSINQNEETCQLNIACTGSSKSNLTFIFNYFI
jgi:hypothetical protein